MTAIRLVLATRRVVLLLGVVIVLSVLATVAAHGAIAIALSQVNPPHKIPDAELIALVTGILAAGVLRPRFWEWDRLGAPRTRVVAGTTTILGMAAPLIPVLAATTRLPDTVAWHPMLSNVLTLDGAVFIVGALLGPALGGGIVIVAYFADAIIDNLARSAAQYLPLADFPDTNALWLPALALPLVAVAINTYNHGASTWAHRLTRNG